MGERVFFQFYDPISFVNISCDIHFFSFPATGKANGNQSGGKNFIKSRSSMLTDGTTITKWWGVRGAWLGLGASLGLGIPPSCHWETHTSCWTQAEMKMPLCCSLSEAKGQAVPWLSVLSQDIWESFGKLWQTSVCHCVELWISVDALNTQGWPIRNEKKRMERLKDSLL